MAIDKVNLKIVAGEFMMILYRSVSRAVASNLRGKLPRMNSPGSCLTNRLLLVIRGTRTTAKNN